MTVDRGRRADRVASGLVVETSRLCAAFEQLGANGELLSQMATMIRDGALEYERVVMAMRQIRFAATTREAKKIAEDCLREI